MRKREKEFSRFTTKFGYALRVDSLSDQLEPFELTDTSQDFSPRSLQIVSINHGDIKESFNRFNVLRLHFSKVVEERELGEGRDESVSFQFEVEQTNDLDSLFEPFE